MGSPDPVIGGGPGAHAGAPASRVVEALLLVLAARAAEASAAGGHDRAGGRLDAGPATPAPTAAHGGPLEGEGALGALVDRFTRNGHGETIGSWIGPGANRPIRPDELAQALGPGNLEALEQQTGLARPQLLAELSRELPQAVDQLTPQGRLPTDAAVMRSGG